MKCAGPMYSVACICVKYNKSFPLSKFWYINITKIFLKEFITIKMKTQRLKRYLPMCYQIYSQNLLNTVFQTFLSYYFCLAPCLDLVPKNY